MKHLGVSLIQGWREKAGEVTLMQSPVTHQSSACSQQEEEEEEEVSHFYFMIFICTTVLMFEGGKMWKIFFK